MAKPARSVTLLLALGVSAILVLAFASPALATSYYGVGGWESCKPNKGIKAYFYVRSGYCADWASGGHLNEGMWTGTDDAQHFENWIEMGYSWGWHGTSDLTWYWARQRPGKPYAEWAIGSAIDTGEWHWLRIQYISNDAWGVYLDGDLKVTCTPATPDSSINSQGLEVGLEATSTNSYIGSGFDASAICQQIQFWRLQEGQWFWGLNDTGGQYGHATTTGYVDTDAGCHAQWWYSGTNDFSNLHSWKVIP